MIQKKPLSARTFAVSDSPCPDCGQRSVIGFYYVNEYQEHMHTHYVCTFWPSSRGEIDPDKIKRQCGLHGWHVPS